MDWSLTSRTSLVLAVKLVDEWVVVQCLCGVTSLLQHNSRKLFCVYLDFSSCCDKFFGAIQPVMVTKSSPRSTDLRGSIEGTWESIGDFMRKIVDRLAICAEVRMLVIHSYSFSRIWWRSEDSALV